MTALLLPGAVDVPGLVVWAKAHPALRASSSPAIATFMKELLCCLSQQTCRFGIRSDHWTGEGKVPYTRSALLVLGSGAASARWLRPVLVTATAQGERGPQGWRSSSAWSLSCCCRLGLQVSGWPWSSPTADPDWLIAFARREGMPLPSLSSVVGEISSAARIGFGAIMSLRYLSITATPDVLMAAFVRLEDLLATEEPFKAEVFQQSSSQMGRQLQHRSRRQCI